MTHQQTTTDAISFQPLAPELPVALKEIEVEAQAQAPTEKTPVYRGSENRLGCHTTWRNGDMSQKPIKPQSPRQRPHTRPMTDNELQHKTNIIALIGLVVLIVFVGLMYLHAGTTAGITAASGGSLLYVGVVQFFKTLQTGKNRRP